MEADGRPHPALERGVRLFNDGRFFEAHEVWEDLWLASEGPLRRYLQGLIQIAAGWHHLRKGNEKGGRRVLAAGIEKLDDFPRGYAGIDAASAVEDSRRILAASQFRATAAPAMRIV